MKKSIIDTGTNKVINVVELEVDAAWQAPDGQIIGPDGGNIGDAYDPATQAYTPPPVPELAVSEQALQNIQVLEKSIAPRRMREALLTLKGKEWLQNVEDQIAAERARL